METTKRIPVLAVFLGLVALTAFEVGVTYLHLERSATVVLLLGSSLAKALLVALFFMHLRFEGKLIWALLLASLVLVAMLGGVLYADLPGKVLG